MCSQWMRYETALLSIPSYGQHGVPEYDSIILWFLHKYDLWPLRNGISCPTHHRNISSKFVVTYYSKKSSPFHPILFNMCRKIIRIYTCRCPDPDPEPGRERDPNDPSCSGSCSEMTGEPREEKTQRPCACCIAKETQAIKDDADSKASNNQGGQNSKGSWRIDIRNYDEYGLFLILHPRGIQSTIPHIPRSFQFRKH